MVNYKFSILDKRIKGFQKGYRQNVVFLGDDPEENTYLIEKYIQDNRLDDIIYIHATASFVDARNFSKSVIFSLLSSYMRKAAGLDQLINLAGAAALSGTTAVIKDTLKQDNISFTDVLEIINKFIEETKLKCVFVIENFLELEVLFGDSYQVFSKFIILQRSCMVVLTTSCLRQAEKILSTELNLLFGNFEVVTLSDNAFLDSYIYLKQLIAPLYPSPFFLSFFVNITGHNVIYYDLMAQVIKENYFRGDEEGAIISILEKTLYSPTTYFFQKFSRNISVFRDSFKDYTTAMRILVFISQGYMRKKELNSLAICDAKELNAKLSKFQELNCLECAGNIYRIKDPLFAFWFSHTFKLHFSPPILDAQKRKFLWREKIEEELSLFKEDFFKDKVKRVLELISSFKDDVLKAGRRKYKLPSITRTKIISYPERSLHFIIGEGREVVFVGIKERNVVDDDIFDFIERGRALRGRGVRKIFISLDQVSPTAKIIAKSHKFVIWDVNEVNRLLNIYNKPIISLGAPQGLEAGVAA